MANYKNGIIRDGASIGIGKILGNLKDSIVREGTYSTSGHGKIVGNIKNDIIREGTYSTAGHGKIILNEKNGDVRKGTYSTAGHGTKIGKTKDYYIKGMERELDSEIVAVYHFLIKKLA